MKRLIVAIALGVSILSACDGDDSDTVPPPAAPVVSLTASASTLVMGSASTLSWVASDASTCTASGAWSGTKSTFGSESVTPSAVGNSGYTLTCTGAAGTGSATTTVVVNSPPLPTATISASPTTVFLGQATTLTWSSTNARGCVGSGAWNVLLAPSGSMSVTPAAVGNAGYTVTCSGAGGGASATATVVVNPPPVPTVTISASPTSILLGQAATLTWSSTNATTCTGSGAWSGVRSTSGNASVTPAMGGNAAFTLTCTGAGGSGNATTNVTVTASFAYVATDAGDVSGYSLDTSSGVPTLLAGGPYPVGSDPWAMAIDRSNRFVYVANRVNNSVSGYSIDSATGALTAITGSPFATGRSANSIAVAPSGQFVYVATGDDGLVTHAVNSTSGALGAASPPVAGGTGVAIHPTGRFVYAITLGGQVLAYGVDTASGALTPVAGGTYSAGTSPNFISIDPAGQYAYVANFSSRNLSAFAIDAASGALSPVAGSPFAAGVGTRSIAIDPSGRFIYVANIGGPTDFGSVSAYTIDRATGALTQMAGSPLNASNYPSSVAVDTTGRFLYVGAATTTPVSNLLAYGIDATSGALSLIAGNPFPVTSFPRAIAVTRVP